MSGNDYGMSDFESDTLPINLNDFKLFKNKFFNLSDKNDLNYLRITLNTPLTKIGNQWRED